MGVPPHKIGCALGTSYNSLIEENDAFLEDTLDPLMTAMEEEFNHKLLKTIEFESDTHLIQFNRDSLRQCDKETEDKILTSQYNNGLISFEEMRQELKRPVKTDGKFRIPNGFTIEGEEPPETAPAAPPQDDQQADKPAGQPKNDQKERFDDRLAVITRSTVERLLKRVETAVTNTSKGTPDLLSHRGVFLENLSAFSNAEAITDQILTNLSEELGATTRDQWSMVCQRIQPETIVRQLI